MATLMKEQFHIQWRETIRLGLFAGLTLLFVCLVGMFATFGEKDVIWGIISQGQAMLVIIWLGFGYFASNKNPDNNYQHSLIAGVLVGAISGVMLLLLVLIAEPINLRSVLVNASPKLIEALTLGLGKGIGGMVLLLVGIIVSVIGVSIPFVSANIRKPLLVGFLWLFGVGVFQDVLAPVLPMAISSFLFDISGLGHIGAILVFFVPVLLSLYWQSKQQSFQMRLDSLSDQHRKLARRILIALGIVLALALPQLLGSFLSDVFGTVGLYVLMGLGLNIVVGYAGLLDLGYVAFFAIGAYVAAVLTSTGELGLGLNFWMAAPFAVLGAILAGVILGIPVLQMRGDYLAIVTMGFGEIIRILALSDALRPYIGGAQGILAVPKINFFGLRLSGPQQLLYLIVAACILAIFISRRLADSRIGRAWMAIREDEDVAEASGIPLVKHKLMAFAAGAAFAGLSGAIFATKLGSVFPHSFKLEVSIWVLCLIIVGGMGSIPGVIAGALFMMGLPELLRTFAEFRLLFYGALLVVMMLVRPEGLLPEEARRRELHAVDSIQ